MEYRMPNREYERNMNHTYMILEKCNYFGEDDKKNDFRKNMLLNNQIPGLLPITHKSVNDSSKYFYEINSMETLENLYKETEISYEQLQKLLLGVIRLFQNLEEYLLEGMQVIMRPDYIYLEPERMEPYFICYPDYEGDVRQEFVELVDYVLAKIDHTDERAVMLSYQVYRYTRNPNYVLSEIHHMLKLVGEAQEVNIPENKRYTPEDEEVLVQNDVTDLDEKELVRESRLEQESKETVKLSGNLKGVRICIVITILAGLLLVEEYMLALLSLSGLQMIYACGVAALSGMIAGILYYTEKKQLKQKDEENEPMEDVMMFTEDRAAYHAGTICLTKDVAKDYAVPTKHSLVGVVNGEEIQYPLNRFPLTIGKQEGVSDLIVPDYTVSRQHARLEQIEGKVYIADANSTNGTLKNGRLLKRDELAPLEVGDSIILGNVSFIFC